jgi:hypothetical protein
MAARWTSCQGWSSPGELLAGVVAAAPTGDGRRVLRAADLRGVRLQDDAGFGRVSFQDYAGFNGATFQGDAGFLGASFEGDAGFGGASFATTPSSLG